MRLAFILIYCALTTACSTSQVDLVRTFPVGSPSSAAKSGEAIVVMARSYHLGNETESKFTACVAKAIGENLQGQNGMQVITDKQFADAMFPWFEPRTAPTDIEALPKLLKNKRVRAKMRETGVRYFVWLDGDTDRTASGGSLSCAAGPGGAGCFGFAWWESDSNYDAAVWDLIDQEETGNIEARVSGTSYIPAIIIPVPMIAQTRATACRDLSAKISEFVGS